MRVTRVASHVAVCAGVALLVGCAKSDVKTADTTAAAAPAATSNTSATAAGAVTPSPVSLADVAGTWKMRSVPTTGTDTTATEYTLTAAATPDGWKIKYANGLVVAVKVTASGDSVITDVGPYASVRRKGVQVTTHGAFRKQGDKLVGTTTAHYKTKGADSLLTLHTEGTKAP